MDEKIQKLISESNHVTLPAGEYKGTFVVDHPCIIEGHNTTLWNNSQTVVLIKSAGVRLKNIRVELIGSTATDIFSIYSEYDVDCENIEIMGKVHGFGGEDSFPDVSRQIKLGEFKSDSRNTFLLEMFSPCDCSTISTQMKDVYIQPQTLKKGLNSIRISINSVTQNSYIYGDLILQSKFNRRFYLSGVSSESGQVCNDIIISSGNYMTQTSNEKIISMVNTVQNAQPVTRAGKINNSDQFNDYCENKKSPNHVSEMPVLHKYMPKRGERIYIQNDTDIMRFFMGCKGTLVKMDIDPYVFLLDKTGITSCDDDFIYFGNKKSRCGSVTFNDDKTIDVDLTRVPDYVERISFVYSIYLPGPNDNFSKVVDPYLTIFQCGEEVLRYVATELFAETTIIFMEIYKHNGRWKINTVGQGYKEGLKKLCSSYGLIVS